MRTAPCRGVVAPRNLTFRDSQRAGSGPATAANRTDPQLNDPTRQRRTADTLAATFSMVTTATTPFLVGTMGTGIGADLGMTVPALAGVISFGYLIASVLSPLGGRLTQRIGAPNSLRLAGGLTSLGVALAALASSSAQLWAAFTAIGLANAVIQPASNGTLSGITTGRAQGLLFGLVQSAVPTATLLAGLLLAALNDVELWRRALWTLFALSLVPQLLIARRRADEESCPTTCFVPAKGAASSTLWLLLVGAFLGSASSTVVAVFGVASGMAGGLSPTAAASGQMLGSLCCIVGRITSAWRWGQHRPMRLLRYVAMLQALGVAGVGLLAVLSAPAYFVGFAVAFGCGWGWTGLQNLALVRGWPDSAARVTGVIQSGLFAGSVVGPVVFGGIVSSQSYSAAWGTAALTMALAASSTLSASLRLGKPAPAH